MSLESELVVDGEPGVDELGYLRIQVQDGIASDRPLRDVTFDLFKDAEGVPRMLYSAVLFLDTIGTTAASLASDASSNLRRLHRAIRFAATTAGTEHPSALQATTWFTDNVVVALPVAAHQSVEDAAMYAALTAAELSVGLLQFGILARGGIALGRVYLDDRFVFGPALIAAHDLEQNAAEPRILLDDDTAVALMNEIDCVAFETTGRSPYLVRRDAEGPALFTNHFDIALSGRDHEPALRLAQQLAKQLEAGYHNAESDRHRDKWVWARELFEEAAKRWVPTYLAESP